MIQRIQSLFLFFSAICLITIVYVFPILKDSSTSYLLSDHFPIVRLIVLCSATLSMFAIFQFRNRTRQKFIVRIARFMITITLLLIVFFYREDRDISSGLLLLAVTFSSLILANLFIRKDEKLLRSIDRIR